MYMMEGKSTALTEKIDKLRMAISTRPDALHNISHHLGYRQRIAQEYYDCKDEAKQEQLYEILEHCNEQIKKILGL